MSPDDPRHGSQAGYRAHRKAGEEACAACKRGAAAAEARNLYRRTKGLTGRIDPTGPQRRLRALAALGYDWKGLGARLDMTGTGVARLALDSSYMHPATVLKIVALYEELSMTLPTLDTPAQRNAASRARNRARRNGWPPPLAFTNIDDPDECPANWQYRAPDRATTLRDLADMGYGITEVCRRLHTSRDALERWCERKGMRNLYVTLCAREQAIWQQEYRNQYTGRKGGAA